MAEAGRLREQILSEELEVSQQGWCPEFMDGGGVTLERELGWDKTHTMTGALGFYPAGGGAPNLYLVSVSALGLGRHDHLNQQSRIPTLLCSGVPGEGSEQPCNWVLILTAGSLTVLVFMSHTVVSPYLSKCSFGLPRQSIDRHYGINCQLLILIQNVA